MHLVYKDYIIRQFRKFSDTPKVFFESLIFKSLLKLKPQSMSYVYSFRPFTISTFNGAYVVETLVTLLAAYKLNSI